MELSTQAKIVRCGVVGVVRDPAAPGPTGESAHGQRHGAQGAQPQSDPAADVWNKTWAKMDDVVGVGPQSQFTETKIKSHQGSREVLFFLSLPPGVHVSGDLHMFEGPDDFNEYGLLHARWPDMRAAWTISCGCARTKDGPAELRNIRDLCVDAPDVLSANTRIIHKICATPPSAKNLEGSSL